MAASFPNAKKTFSVVVNGVTKLVAALFNTPDDEIEAVQTFIGPTGGGAQTYSENMTNMLFNYRRACNVDYKGVADLYVRAGEIMVTDASGNRRLRRNTADTTVDWGDIDTGSEANSTQYYVYAVADAAATTFTVMISTNATTPTGATYYKKIGSFYNNASGNIESVIDYANTNAVQITDTSDRTGTGSEADLGSLTLTFITKGTKMLVLFSAPFKSSAQSDTVTLYINIDDSNVRTAKVEIYSNVQQIAFQHLAIGLTPGSHTVKMRWNTSANMKMQGSTSAEGILTVIDL